MMMMNRLTAKARVSNTPRASQPKYPAFSNQSPKAHSTVDM